MSNGLRCKCCCCSLDLFVGKRARSVVAPAIPATPGLCGHRLHLVCVEVPCLVNGTEMEHSRIRDGLWPSRRMACPSPPGHWPEEEPWVGTA